MGIKLLRLQVRIQKSSKNLTMSRFCDKAKNNYNEAAELAKRQMEMLSSDSFSQVVFEKVSSNMSKKEKRGILFHEKLDKLVEQHKKTFDNSNKLKTKYSDVRSAKYNCCSEQTSLLFKQIKMSLNAIIEHITKPGFKL